MATYILRRLILFVPTLLAMSLVVFAILALAPGDPLTRYEQALQTTYNYSAEAAQQRTDLLRERYGIDQPFLGRYATWVGQFVTGDFGVSFENFQPVADLVGPRLLYSLVISLSAFVFMYVVGVPIGIWTAYRQYGVTDYVASVGSFLGLSIPDFFLALLVLVALYVWFNVPPPQGLFSPEFVDAPWTLDKVLDLIRGLILPVLIIGSQGLAKIVRITRSNMLDILEESYIRTARAKGLREWRVIVRHAFRVAANPLISLFGTQFPNVLSGEIVVSIVLGLPTLGPLLLQSLLSLDMFVSTTILMMQGALLLVGNLLADILLATTDPRIRLR
ncbi:ABC transporter permease subunit [Devosia sp. D6-9]|nr:ABC transporter permease subunit [Devosia sp. D6-9]